MTRSIHLRFLALLAAAVVLFFSVPLQVFAADAGDALNPAVRWLRRNPPEQLHILLFTRLDEKPKSAAVTDMGIVVRETEGNFASVIRHSQTLLSVIASGYDPTDRDGVDLVRTLLNDPAIEREGAQGIAWALLALGSAPLSLPEDTLHSIPSLVQQLTAAQTVEGYLPYASGQGEDLLTTALAIMALSNWEEQPGVPAFLQQARSWLAAQQQADGSFREFDPVASSGANYFASGRATAMAALALDDPAAYAALPRFAAQGGGYARELGGKADVFTTEWAALALCAAQGQDVFALDGYYLSDQPVSPLQAFGGFAVRSVGICAIIYLVLVMMQKRYEKHGNAPAAEEAAAPAEANEE